MESMFYWVHRFLGGINNFWMAVRVWKTNLVLEDLARKKRTKMWSHWRLLWDLTEVWDSEWSVVSWIWIIQPSTTFWPWNWVCGKFVQSCFQNPHQRKKENGRNVCLDLLKRIENDGNFFRHVITGDESWIFEYDPETKRQIAEWHTSNSPRQKKAIMSNRKPNPC